MTDQQQALAAALDQIAVAFGREEGLTPEQHKARVKRRLDELLVVREGLAKLAEADLAKERDEQGWTTLDPVMAYVVAWYIRKEGDSDYVLGEYGLQASNALEEVADGIEGGEILACPQDMLIELDEMIDELRAAIADTLPTGPGRETGPVRKQG